MQDAKDLFETDSSPTATPEEADRGSTPTSEAAGLLAAEVAARPKGETPSVTENADAHEVVKAEALDDGALGATIDPPAREGAGGRVVST